MPGRCAIWLDHSKALIVRFTPEGDANVEEIRSGIKGMHKTTGGAGTRAPNYHGYVSKSSEEERRHHQLTKFYDRITSKVGMCTKVMILGSGLAKQELSKAMENLPGQRKPRLEVHPAKKMTEKQLVALVRKEFGVSRPL